MADTERYLNDLMDMETYLTGLQEVVTACEASEENSEFLSQYAECLEALRIKQHQLDGVREFVRERPTDPASSLLSEMLDEVEPLCREVIQTMSRLSSSSAEPEAEEQGLNDDDDLLEHVGLEQNLTPTDPVTDAAPSDVRDTDQTVTEDDARDVQASAADTSHGVSTNNSSFVGNVSVIATPLLFDETPCNDLQICSYICIYLNFA